MTFKKLELLPLVGAIALAASLCQATHAAERPSTIVVAQQQGASGANKNAEDKKRKDEKGKGAAKDNVKPTEQQKPANVDRKAQERGKLAQPTTQDQTLPARQKQHEQKAQDKGKQQAPATQNQTLPAQQKQHEQKAQEKGKQPPATQNQTLPAQQKKFEQKAKEKGKPPQPAQNQIPPAQQGKPEQKAQEKSAPPQPASTAKDTRKIEQLRSERKEEHIGNRTVIREQTRTIIRENGRTIIRHDDTDRFRHGARDVHEERRGNERIVVVERPDGTRITNVYDIDGRLLRRTRWERGREVILIDNRYREPRAGFSFILKLPPPVVHIPRERYIVEADRADGALLYETLIAPPVMQIERPYTLDEIRYNDALRERMPRIDLDSITFDTGSWEVTPDQARLLEPIAEAMRRAVERNPNEVYMIEGHTDAVGADDDNLSLSDRRAQSVAEILTDDFGIPPENLVTQGYGEQYLKVPTPGPERRNRRVTVRRITPLLAGRS